MGDTEILREFCAENFTNVPAAIAAGARRIELCDNLAESGTTPSFGVIEHTVAYAHAHGARVMTMIRPRGGDFVYSEDELAMMEADVFSACEAETDGIVFGCLREEDGAYALDVPACERIMSAVAAAGTPIMDNVARLRELTEHAAGRLIILPGAGITYANVDEVVRAVGAPEAHGTKIVRLA